MYPLVMMLAMLMWTQLNSPNVILVTIDGTRWQEVYNGSDHARDRGHSFLPRHLVPNLYQNFVDQGIAFGKDSPMVATGPNHISLPGYLEITRGHPSTDCQTNTCKPTIDHSVFWAFQHPTLFSSWISVCETVPPNDIKATTNCGNEWYRSDAETIQLTNQYLDNNLAPDFLWVALGDTDEWAHHNDYPNYLAALQQADAFVGSLVRRYPNSFVIITVDHGRANDFKDHGKDRASGRVWCMMRGPGIQHLGFVTTESISLSNILPTIMDVEFNHPSADSMLERIFYD